MFISVSKAQNDDLKPINPANVRKQHAISQKSPKLHYLSEIKSVKTEKY